MYILITGETIFTRRTIYPHHQLGHSILLTITHGLFLIGDHGDSILGILVGIIIMVGILGIIGIPGIIPTTGMDSIRGIIRIMVGITGIIRIIMVGITGIIQITYMVGVDVVIVIFLTTLI